MKILKYLLSFLCNEYGKGGGSGGTSVVEEPGPTPQQLELIDAQLNLERQHQQLIEEYGGRYQELERDQLQAYAAQAEQQQQMLQKLSVGLSPTEQEELSRELEAELIAKQLGYQRGEIPDLLPEEAAGLEAYTQLAREQTLADVLRSYESGMIQAKNAALMRGLGSSSYREGLEGGLGQQAVGTLGAAEQAIQNLKYQAAWEMPRATQIYETGLSELQQAINLQAEQNRATMAANLAALNVQGVNPLDILGNVEGTRFTYDPTAEQAEPLREGEIAVGEKGKGYTPQEIARMNPNYRGRDKITMPGT